MQNNSRRRDIGQIIASRVIVADVLTEVAI